MMEAKEKHGKHMNQFSDEIRRRFPGALIIGDSQCQQCKVCTYPTAPCRFPDKKSSAMSAFGMIVSAVCEDNHIPYYYGPGTLTYVGCVLVEAGNNRNTLEEVLAAMPYLADAVLEALET